MLVLVSQLIEDCFGALKHRLESIIAVLLLCLSTMCVANLSECVADSDGQSPQPETSVLVLVNEEEPSESPKQDESVGASPATTVVNNESSGNATFTARPLSPAPSPPQDLLVPAKPDESDFTRPFANELRGEAIPTNQNASNNSEAGATPQTSDDGINAQGTFASSNQAFQDRPGTGGRPPVQPVGEFQPPVSRQSFGPGISRNPAVNPAAIPSGNPTQFGQDNRQGIPTRRMNEPFSNHPPALSNQPSESVPPISDKPSAWRDAAPATSSNPGLDASAKAPNSSQSSNVRSFNSLPGQSTAPPIRTANNLSVPYRAQQSGQLAVPDSNVRPTGFSQPEPEMTTALAKSLVAKYSADSTSVGLPGRPVKLVEMLREPIPVQQRRAMVNQFWETYYDWANYVSAQDHAKWLKRVPSPPSMADKALLEATIAAAENTALAAKIQFGKSQSGLAQYMPNRQSTDLLPLPNDLPLIRRYKTNYEAYRSRRMMPVSLMGIDEMLPATLDLIVKRAEVVRMTDRAASQVLSSQSSLTTALATGRAKRNAERDLVASVVSYNQAIGDYSLSVTGGQMTPESIVAMLIERPKATVAQASSVLAQPSQPRRDTGLAPGGSFGQGRAVGGQTRPLTNGTPSSGIPNNGRPNNGRPNIGTPSSGTPSSGTTSSGTPNAGSPGKSSQFNLGSQGVPKTGKSVFEGNGPSNAFRK